MACYDELSAKVFRRNYRAQARETAAQIAEKFGQPWHCYGQLVACNMDRPLLHTGLSSLGPTIAIREGDRLQIPARWAMVGGSLGAPGVLDWDKIQNALKDTKLDPITVTVLDLVQKGMGGFVGMNLGPNPVIDPALQTMIANATTQWWRQQRPNDVPTPLAFLPYFQRAAAWARAWGAKMNPIDATGFPWAQIDPDTIPDYADVLKLPIDWNAVRSWLATHMSKQDPLPPAAPITAWQNPALPHWNQQPYASWPWLSVPWASIPFDRVPFETMNLEPVRQAKGSQAMTKNLIAQLAQVYPVGAANPTVVGGDAPPGSGDGTILPTLPAIPAVPTVIAPYLPTWAGGPATTPPAPPAAPPPPDGFPWVSVLAGAAVLGVGIELFKLFAPGSSRS